MDGAIILKDCKVNTADKGIIWQNGFVNINKKTSHTTNITRIVIVFACVPTDTVLVRSDARMHIVSFSTHLLQKIRPNNVVHACVKPAKKHKNKDNI